MLYEAFYDPLIYSELCSQVICKKCKVYDASDKGVQKILVFTPNCRECGEPLPEYHENHMSQFKEMIEPKQSYHVSEKYNAVIINDVYEHPDLDLWVYFDKLTGEFREMRVE